MIFLAILLIVLATLLLMIAVIAAGNIYDVPPVICYACRWAVFLWILEIDVGLFALAIKVGWYS